LRSDTSDQFTSGTLATLTGTTLRVNGDLAVADANISFSSGTGTTFTPVAGQSLNVALSGAGDFAVNTNQLYVDTSTARVGINTTVPGASLSINGSTAFVAAAATTLLTGAIAINPSKSYIRVGGNAGAITMTANPQISPGVDGQIIILKGTSNTNTVNLLNTNGLTMTDGNDFALGNKDMIKFIYDAVDGQWIELFRSDKI